MVTKLVYFAWVRERIGKPEEEVSLPASVETVADLLRWLKGAATNTRMRCRHPEVIRVAINHEHVDHREKIAGAGEIALFPPMTGG